MKNIGISPSVSEAVKDLLLGAVYAETEYQKHTKGLWHEIDNEIHRISQIPIDKVKQIEQIKGSREAYKALGKEPARYRLSAEALHRRIIKGKGIYQISNIVDVINLASVKSGYSIGGYDVSKVIGDIIFDLGKSDEDYEAIGRGKINIENLPVFRDDIGAFGSPTSDSVRTMISEKTNEILLIVINFGAQTGFEKDLNKIAGLIERYCKGSNIEISIF